MIWSTCVQSGRGAGHALLERASPLLRRPRSWRVCCSPLLPPLSLSIRQGIIENVNPATARMFGYEPAELLGRNVKMLMPEPYRAEHDGYLANYLGTGVKKIIGIGREVSGRRKDGAVFPVHLAVSEFSTEGQRHFTGIIHDLSDRKHVEEALRESERRLAQAQKMEAVGQLTGGIAHDFNNLLTIITGNLELVQDRLQPEDLRVLVKKAQDAAELGAQLTSQLLTFARRRTQDVQTIQLNELLLSVTEMLRRTLGDHVSLSSSLSPDLWHTQADPGQFQNAIVNLAVNGRDAMPKGGRILSRRATRSWMRLNSGLSST